MNRQQRRAEAKASGRTARATPATDTIVGPMLEEAASAHRAGNIAQAEAGYRRVLEIDPQQGDALNLLGVLALQTGDFEKAARLLKPVVKNFPKVANFRVTLANALRGLGQAKEAEKQIREALRFAPGSAEAHAGYAQVLAKDGDFKLAEKHFRKAISIDPTRPDTNNHLAALLRQLNRHEEALVFCDRAIAAQPGFAPALTAKGLTLIELQRAEESLFPLEKAVELEPNDVTSHGALATALAMLGRIDEAQQHFQAALEIDPGNAFIHSETGWAMHHSGQQDKALGHFLRALEIKPGFEQAQVRLLHVLQFWHPAKYISGLDQQLLEACKNPSVRTQTAARPLARQILCKISATSALETNDIERALDVLSNPLAKWLLTRTINCVPEFEVVLVGLRRCLLMEETEQLSDTEKLSAVSLLAQQAHNNNYVWWFGEDESQKLSALGEEVSKGLANDSEHVDALELKLLRYAMYAPLDRLPNSEAILTVPSEYWSEPVQPILERALHEPNVEKKIRSEILALGPITDDVSRAVQEQYEANPYPRWLSHGHYEQTTLDQTLGTILSGFEPPAWSTKPVDVLIAGCGTGQQVVSRALRTACNKITAVDLSRTSLAYAMRMTQKYGIDKIEYLQGDILELGKLGRDFQMIECTGVLHHMDDPTAGWSVLTGLLRPGGVMLIGLYSELARHQVVAARKRITELGLKPEVRDIRDFRKRIVEGADGQDHVLSRLRNSNDFYALDSCRDLVFHVQEHRLTIPELAQVIAGQGLEFLGFMFEDPLPNLYYAREFPDDVHRTNLENWAAFENRRPDTFSLMYQFWCRKPE